MYRVTRLLIPISIGKTSIKKFLLPRQLNLYNFKKLGAKGQIMAVEI